MIAAVSLFYGASHAERHAPEMGSDTVKPATVAVSETMKDAFDITAHVRKNPWAAVGISALLGGIVGCLTASP